MLGKMGLECCSNMLYDPTSSLTIDINENIPLCSSNKANKQSQNYFGICRSSFLFYVLLVTYAVFLIFGALVFNLLEAPEEAAVVQRLKTVKYQFMIDHPTVSDEALETLISEVVRASNRGVSAARNVSSAPNWSFGQSLFFTTTVVTTIGYGHVTPLSRSGKLFCVGFALIGIPLTLILLSALVERLLLPTFWFLRLLNSRLGHLFKPFNIRLLHLTIMIVLLVIFFMLIPAALFTELEHDWNYLDSFYYCFISLTTIGLGDYIPGDSPDQPHRPLYKIITTAYLFVGITFVMLILAVFYDIPQLNLGLLFSVSEETDSEKMCLAGSGTATKYGAGNTYEQKYEENTHRHVVRVRSRRDDDSPSPDDVPSKDVRLP